MRRFPWLSVAVVGALLGVTSFVVIRPDRPAAAQGLASPPPGPVISSTSTDASGTERFPSTSSAGATTTTTTPTDAGPSRPLVIQGVGDVNFDPGYIPAFAEEGYEMAFDGIDGIFLEDDLTVINLECPPSDAGAQADKDYSFHCDPAALPIAAEHGVDVANLANNHGQDRGVEGLLDAIVNLSEAGITPVGAGADVAGATAPGLFEIDGWTVAVLGMGGVVPGDEWLATDQRPGMASGDDIQQMVTAVEDADEIADIVVVTVHWGTELVIDPNPQDRSRAEAMVAAGADVIFGHHPHRLGEVEMIDGAPVFWTLGNFIWPRLSDAGATTAVARVTFDPGGGVEACLIPAFIEVSGRPEIRGDPVCGELS